VSAEFYWEHCPDESWCLVSGDGTELASVRRYGKLQIDDIVFSWIYLCESPGKISFECQILERSLHKCEMLLRLWTVSTDTQPSAVPCGKVVHGEHSYRYNRPVGYHFQDHEGLVKEAGWLAPVQAPRFLRKEDAEAYAAVMVMRLAP